MKIFLIVLWASLCTGYKILIPLPFTFRSVSNLFVSVANSLAENGHEVTILTPYASSNTHPNTTMIVLPEEMKMWDNLHFFNMRTYNNVSWDASELFVKNTKLYLADTRVQDLWIRRNEFQAILTYFQLQESTLHFLIDYEGAYIHLCSTGVDMSCHSILGNYISPAITPIMFHMFEFHHQSFWARLTNFLQNTQGYDSTMKEPIEKMMALQKEKYPSLRSYQYYMDEVDLTLTNTHYVADYAVPLLPNQIEIGCINCVGKNDIPKDLLKVLDGSGDDGVIYFSLGSMVNTDHIPKDSMVAILEAFGKLPQRVIMKVNWQEELPPNVIARNWLPQQDILAHPKTRLFVSHCGLQSVHEARHHGVPILAMPVAIDQIVQAESVVDFGIAEMMIWENITAQNMLDMMKKLLSDPSYTQRAKKISTLMQDQIDTPGYRANWWVEYAIRNHKYGNIYHKGQTRHVLHFRGKDLSLYQYLMVDVILFLVSICLLAVVSFCIIIKCICKMLYRKPKKMKKS